MRLLEVVLYTLTVITVVFLFGPPLVAGLDMARAFFTMEQAQFNTYRQLEGEK